MSWAVGFDRQWNRDVGYGVPSTCDYPGCEARIDRGLGYVCGGEPYGGDRGCGLYFCEHHTSGTDIDGRWVERCDRCDAGQDPYTPTPDVEEWTAHKLTDPSWAAWRAEHGIAGPDGGEG